MAVYYGTHGTTRSRAEDIAAAKFKICSVGERGTGVYFWHKNILAEKLAIGWYCNQLARGSYSKDEKKTCSVIEASFTAEDDEYINIEDPDEKAAIIQFLETNNIEDVRDVGKAYDLFLESVETELVTKLVLVYALVWVPTRSKCFRTQSVGMAGCYIVKCPDRITTEVIRHYDERIEKCETVNVSKQPAKKHWLN